MAGAGADAGADVGAEVVPPKSAKKAKIDPLDPEKPLMNLLATIKNMYMQSIGGGESFFTR